MKNIISIISTLTLCLTFTSCNTAQNNESEVIIKRDLNDYKNPGIIDTSHPSGWGLTDCFPSVYVYYDIELLEAESELIVVGEFIDNSKLCRYVDDSGPRVKVDNFSSCPLRITRVLAGNAEAGDVINIFQDEWFSNDGTFHTDSNLTPMQLGDEWAFFLRRADYDKYGNGWWCVGDDYGRYPTKNSGSNEKVCYSAYPELGVYKRRNFHEDFYNQLVEKYDV